MIPTDQRFVNADSAVTDAGDNQSAIQSVCNRFSSNLSDNFITHSLVFNNRYWSLPNHKNTSRIVTVIFMVAVAASVLFGSWAYLSFGAAYFGTALIAGGSTLGAELLLSLMLPNRKNLEDNAKYSAVKLGVDQEEDVEMPPELKRLVADFFVDVDEGNVPHNKDSEGSNVVIGAPPESDQSLENAVDYDQLDTYIDEEDDPQRGNAEGAF